jgi:hypothetical protein
VKSKKGKISLKLFRKMEDGGKAQKTTLKEPPETNIVV